MLLPMIRDDDDDLIVSILAWLYFLSSRFAVLLLRLIEKVDARPKLFYWLRCGISGSNEVDQSVV